MHLLILHHKGRFSDPITYNDKFRKVTKIGTLASAHDVGMSFRDFRSSVLALQTPAEVHLYYLIIYVNKLRLD